VCLITLYVETVSIYNCHMHLTIVFLYWFDVVLACVAVKQAEWVGVVPAVISCSVRLPKQALCCWRCPCLWGSTRVHRMELIHLFLSWLGLPLSGNSLPVYLTGTHRVIRTYKGNYWSFFSKVQFVNYAHYVYLRLCCIPMVIINRDTVLGSSVWFFFMI